MRGAFARRRLDSALAELFPQTSRARWQKIIADGGVTLRGGVCARASAPLRGGEELALRADDGGNSADSDANCAPEDIALDILYEDDEMAVINKPPGLVVHPGRGNRGGTMQAALLFRFPQTALLPRAGIVHRLDKDTSGLLAAAKTARAQMRLAAQFQKRTAGREYLALVFGEPPQTGVVDRPLGRSRRDPTKMAVREGGRRALTRFAVEARWRGFALLRCFLETGRTHQIRAHLEHLGCPLAGDASYKRRARALPFPLSRQMLHAETLRLRHPQSGGECEWKSPPPPDMRAALARLDADYR